MKSRHVLARLAGAQPALLESAPSDSIKHTAMGCVLLSTAAVAGVSATFALNTAVKLDTVPSVIAGVLWAMAIFSLDRMLVVSMVRQSGVLRNMATVLPRMGLAVVIGAVVSAPLVLRIFQPEIDSELLLIQHERAIANQQDVERRFADIATAQQKVDELQARASGAGGSSVSADQDVRTATAARDAAKAAYDKAAADAQCELIGTCGTMTAGTGEAWKHAQALADQARNAYEAAQRHLDEVTAAATQRISTSVTSTQEAARRELDVLVPQLHARMAARDAELAKANDVEGNNSGLLIRIEALDRLTAKQPSMAMANWALLLLFMAIELLPVLTKLLLMLGKESHYEKLVATQERQLEQHFIDESQRRQQRSTIQDTVLFELEQDRAAAQLAAGKKANALLVDKQAEIAERAIEVWGEVAISRSEADLHRWRATHSMPSPAHQQFGPPSEATAMAGASNNYAPDPPTPSGSYIY